MLGEGGMEVSEEEVGELGEREVVSTGEVVMSSGGAVSKYAGFKRSMDTVSFRPCKSRVKYLEDLFSTRKGPS